MCSDNGLIACVKVSVSLRRIQLEECHMRIMQAGFFGILLNHCKKLKIFSLVNCFGVEELNVAFPLVAFCCNSLVSLPIRNCPGVGTIDVVVGMNGGSPKFLIVDGCRHVTDATLVEISKSCYLLNELDASKCGITDYEITTLACPTQLHLQILSLFTPCCWTNRYCMLGYCVDAPVDWCCEECDIRKGIMSSSSGLENVHYEGSKLHVFEKICQSTVQPNKHSKFPRGHRINWEKEVQIEKMRYLPVEEALGPDGFTSLEHTSPDDLNKSQIMNSSTTYPGDPSLVPSRKSERYIALVKFMRSKDLVMRTLINDVELLILASIALCSEPQNVACCAIMLMHQWIGVVKNSTVQPKKHSKSPDGHRINWEKEGFLASLELKILPDECLFEIFKRLSSGQERSASACVPKRWLTLLSNIRKDEITESNGYLDISLVGRISIDVTLAAIAVGTANRGGLAMLSIQGNSLYRGVTDVGLKAIAQGCATLKELSLSNVSSVGDEGLSEIAHGCHLLEKFDLFHCSRITDKPLLGIAKNCLHLNSLSMNDCSYIENESLKIMGQYCLNLKLVGLKNCPLIGDQGILDLFYSAGHILTRVKLEELNINDISLDIISHIWNCTDTSISC
ncbi:hypothetical protein RDI58_015674 [Solanum bulbocastanum]|uniref:F-box/LRR-repeat protein 15-like leucin rich repeat domain-containing protein n=1 Tax=Solanum bulbocastanum TaxID=147425 RepID=A0AAN8YBS9_SOLBU